jgi:uncharacterized protein YqgV (UPF0045/DUF77 family)/DNA-directed RNA polymerase subunit RPC12/RpoP
MGEYEVHECKDCSFKGLHKTGISDGLKCKNCGSGLYFKIAEGSETEMLEKLVEKQTYKDSILKLKYKTNSLELNFEGSVEDGLKILRQLEPPVFIMDVDEKPKNGKITINHNYTEKELKKKEFLEELFESIRRVK